MKEVNAVVSNYDVDSNAIDKDLLSDYIDFLGDCADVKKALIELRDRLLTSSTS